MLSDNCWYGVKIPSSWIDTDVYFDFIKDKMLKANERVIFTHKYLDDEFNLNYMRVMTIDEWGNVRKYIKELSYVDRWSQVGVV